MRDGTDAGPAHTDAALPASAGGRALLFTALLAAGAFAVVLAGVRSPLFDLDRHSIPKELAVHVTALCALLLLAHRWKRVEAGVVEVLLAAFVVWSALSALLAVNHWIALRAFGLTFSAFVVFATARIIAREKPDRVARLVGALAIAATLAAAIGAAQAYGLDLPWLADERAPGGTFGNRNFLAHLTVIAIPSIALMSVRSEWRPARVFWFSALAIAGNAVVLTRSRAAWLGLAAALTVLTLSLVLHRRSLRPAPSSRRRFAIAISAIAVGALSAIVMPNRLEWRSDSPYAETIARIADYRTGSGRGRLIQYRNSLRLAAADPVFGTGPGNWFVKYPLVTTPGDPSFAAADPIPTNPWPSSDWVALLAERGAIAVLLMLMTGSAIVVIALRRLGGVDQLGALLASTLLGTLAAAAVTGLFDAVLLNAAPAYFVAALAGGLLPTTAPVIERPLEGRPRRLAVGAALILAGSLVLYAGAQLRSIRITADSDTRASVERALSLDPANYRLRLVLARNGPCSARIEHARIAARLLPFHPAPERALRYCGVQR